jgi:hypothetical protein
MPLGIIAEGLSDLLRTPFTNDFVNRSLELFITFILINKGLIPNGKSSLINKGGIQNAYR